MYSAIASGIRDAYLNKLLIWLVFDSFKKYKIGKSFVLLLSLSSIFSLKINNRIPSTVNDELGVIVFFLICSSVIIALSLLSDLRHIDGFNHKRHSCTTREQKHIKLNISTLYFRCRCCKKSVEEIKRNLYCLYIFLF